MRALVISGGGSKGAFAGGVAQYLIEEQKNEYDLYLGTSTGSLLIPHLALGKVQKIKEIYSNVTQKDIFSICPFKVKKKYGQETISIHHFNVLRNFFRKSKTFGESNALRKLVASMFTEEEFLILKMSSKNIIITVSNFTLNEIEYKSINDFTYEEFLDWIWISCNYIPFMSLVKKNGCEYGDGGFGVMVPIEEAIKRGATEIDVIVLQTEISYLNRMPSRNAFALLSSMFSFVLDRIEHQNIKVGTYLAQINNVKLNLYYTPTVLTTNSLVFNKEKMQAWWTSGFSFALERNKEHIP